MPRLIRFTCAYLVLLLGVFSFSLSRAELRRATGVLGESKAAAERPHPPSVNDAMSSKNAVITSQN